MDDLREEVGTEVSGPDGKEPDEIVNRQMARTKAERFSKRAETEK